MTYYLISTPEGGAAQYARLLRTTRQGRVYVLRVVNRDGTPTEPAQVVRANTRHCLPVKLP